MDDRTATAPAPPGVQALRLQLLRWIAERPRSYAETMEAWRTSCPRLSVWEDAAEEGLVCLVSSEPGQSATGVQLTGPGAAMLAESYPAAG